MILHLDLEAHASLADVPGFVAGNHDGSVQMPERKQAYAHIGQIPRRFSYWRLGRPDKGLLQRYPARTTGFSRAQLKRLIARRVQHAQRWGAAARFGGAAGDAGARACPTAVPRWGGLVAGRELVRRRDQLVGHFLQRAPELAESVHAGACPGNGAGADDGSNDKLVGGSARPPCGSGSGLAPILLVKALDAALRIHELALARVERMGV